MGLADPESVCQAPALGMNEDLLSLEDEAMERVWKEQ